MCFVFCFCCRKVLGGKFILTLCLKVILNNWIIIQSKTIKSNCSSPVFFIEQKSSIFLNAEDDSVRLKRENVKCASVHPHGEVCH